MTGWRLLGWAIVLLFVAAVLQGAIAPRIALAGAPPDFMVIAVSCLALVSGRSDGAVIGFFAGLLSASLAMASFGAHVVSRTVAGFVAGWAPRLLLPGLWFTGPVVTFGAVIVSQTVFLLISPQADLGHWVKLTLSRAAYSAVLSIPLYVIVLRATKRATARSAG